MTLGDDVSTPARASPAKRHAGAGRDDVFFTAVEQAGLPMVVTDPRQADNPVVFANDAFLRMTGYSSAEVLGRNCRSMRGPETDAEAIDAIRRASASDRSSPSNC